MHELSVALSILELAQKEALAHQAHRVTELEIEVGKLSGIDTEALSFVLQSVIRQTELENCNIRIYPIEATARCLQCGNEYPIQRLPASCPCCNSYQCEFISGKELKLKSLLID